MEGRKEGGRDREREGRKEEERNRDVVLGTSTQGQGL